MKRTVRLIRAKDGNGFECSGCGKKFFPIPFKPDEVLRNAFEEHVRKNHPDEQSLTARSRTNRQYRLRANQRVMHSADFNQLATAEIFDLDQLPNGKP